MEKQRKKREKRKNGITLWTSERKKKEVSKVERMRCREEGMKERKKNERKKE